MYNLKYGNSLISDNDIFELTKKLGIYNKIMQLEKGFDTNVGTYGSKLSGGEKQRILLARSILTNSKILILDEPTSNLDSNNENIVMNLIEEIKNDKTIIICSHRLNTLDKCDNIYVLNHGVVVESGKHNELIKKVDSFYYDLYKHHFTKNKDEK